MSIGKAHAQLGPYRIIGINEGLPTTWVYNIQQDKKGYLWMASNAGILRYDGKTFKPYNTSNGLTTNIIINFTLDNDDETIYATQYNKPIVKADEKLQFSEYNPKIVGYNSDRILSNKYLLCQTGETRSIHAYMQNFKIFLKENNTITIDTSWHTKIKQLESRTIFKLSKDTAFIATNNNIYTYCKQKLQSILPANLTAKFTTDAIQKVIVNASNEFIILTKTILYKYNIGGNFTEIALLPVECGTVKTLLYQDKLGRIWVYSFLKGLYIFDKGNWINFANITNETNKLQINDIFEDRMGNIWLPVTGKGIYCFYNNFIKNLSSTNSLKNENIGAIALGDEHTIWATGFTSIYKYKNSKVVELANLPLLNPSAINYNKGVIYVNNASEIEDEKKTRVNDFYFSNAQILFKENNTITTSFLDRSFKTDRHFKILQYNEKNKLINQHLLILPTLPVVNARAKGAGYYKQYFYMYTANKLVFYDTTTYEFKVAKIFEPIVFGNAGITNAIIKNDTIYLATQAGIYLIKDTTMLGKMGLFYGKDLNKTRKLFIDNKQRLWANGEYGLYIFDKEKTYQLNYTTGLNSNEINAIQYDSISDKAWVGTSSGLNEIDFSQLYQQHFYPPILKLLNITVGTENYKTADKRITMNEGNVEIELELFILNEHNTYTIEYTVNGGLPVTTTDTKISLPSLSPGDYKIILKAKTLNSEWSYPLEIRIHVRTPFYKLPVFYVGLLCIAFLAYIFYNRKASRKKQIVLQNALQTEKQIKELQHQGLSAMMNPHFIFNCLNLVQMHMNKSEMHEANEYLAQLARLIRMNLQAIRQTKNTITAELELLQLYLGLEQSRFKNKFDFKINASNIRNPDKKMIPAAMIQPFVENALIHGVLPYNKKGLIEIEAVEKTGTIEITIKDNGKGENADIKKEMQVSHISVSTKIIEERIEIMKKEYPDRQIFYSIQPADVFEGTIVKLALPIIA